MTGTSAIHSGRDGQPPIAPQAILGAWFDIAPEDRAAVFEWHGREHLPERIGIAGFLRGRRFSAVDADSQFLILYDAASLATLASAPYLERLDKPTDWTRRSVGLMRNQRRAAAAILDMYAIGSGGFVLTIRLRAGRRADPAAVESMMGAMLASPGVVATRFCRTDDEISSLSTTESRAGGHAHVATDHFFIVEGVSPDHLRSVARLHLDERSLGDIGFHAASRVEIFQLQIAVTRTDLS